MTSYAHHLADQANARLTRDDIEWAVNGDQIYLRDKLESTSRRTEAMARKAERERQEWQRNNHREWAD